ncbi:DUF3566 domain-containing protein [Mycolicibacterium aichiense]|uniref:DUF3566 domain-containing protein n=1 Tax=Mycolicibacterium aichiense TaxID=1799 RepID=A0AAD1MG38_9MYCO|nr:DUF3566 domain-containing protein [Mycolicibacterium aichiense]MCV7018691.1 DUF3566 domain-containing protein [Mycolicibacterium aichiense]BBX10834.1 hypothetical protein MAIC_56370 [Mycolicibacterium aichiense]STZ25510.1 putative integral membrane protein [Mycolicibacterium aichiense]
MSAPNEPGQPGPSEGPGNGTGSAERTGPRLTNGGSGEAPPWQRGAARARQGGAPQRPAGEAQPRQAPPGGPGLEQRVNRFISGTAAPDLGSGGPQQPERQQPERQPEQRAEPRPDARPEPRPEPRAEGNRSEAARPEGYVSELPDLSGVAPPKPVAQQRKPAADQPARPAGAATRVQVGANRSRGPVRASMQIRRIDPWSALKVSLLLSVALFFVWMVAVAFLYLVLGGMGVWSKLNSNVGDLLTATSGGGGELVSSGTIFGGAALIGLVNIVLLTAMATVGAFIYNLSTDIVGGVEVTLADRD